jgi:hypothetical protein
LRFGDEFAAVVEVIGNLALVAGVANFFDALAEGVVGVVGDRLVALADADQTLLAVPGIRGIADAGDAAGSVVGVVDALVAGLCGGNPVTGRVYGVAGGELAALVGS